jgi:hypothetical protein
VPDGLIADAVLLTIERQSDERSREDIGRGTRRVVEGAVADPKPNVTETEMGAPWCTKVFARSQ